MDKNTCLYNINYIKVPIKIIPITLVHLDDMVFYLVVLSIGSRLNKIPYGTTEVKANE